MLQVLIFDLGETLIDVSNHPFPGVSEALTAISNFVTENGKPLRSCLVSDFTMAVAPVTAAKVTALFNQYLTILDGTGLRHFFEPVTKRVTLSTHVGKLKPAREVFEKALQRLGASTVPLRNCLFITENAVHIAAARTQLHMQALHFGVDFHNWSEAPALIADRVAPHHFANTSALIKAHLAEHGVDLISAEPGEEERSARVHGQVWQSISVPEYEDLRDVQVAIPVEGNVSLKKGSKKIADLPQPSQEQVAEAATYAKGLAANDKIAGPGKKLTRGATHQIETDEKGNRKLVRKRFSAL